MTRRLPAVEGEPVAGLTTEERRLLTSRLLLMRATTRSRLAFHSGSGPTLRIKNLVGSVQVTPDLVIDVAPKVEADVGWPHAVFDLLTTRSNPEYGGPTDQAVLHAVKNLPDAFARIYADQLDKAVRREGPLSLIKPHYTNQPTLAGRLDVTAWLTQRMLKPANFPQHRSRLSQDNEFTNAMAWVATRLAAGTEDWRAASRLRNIVTRLRPGLPTHTTVDPGVVYRDVPPQWRAYGPAWTSARAILRHIAPLHRDGSMDGLGLAVESWPLLETLLAVSLKRVGTLAADEGIAGVVGTGHNRTRKLRVPVKPGTGPFTRLHKTGRVEPDGILRQHGQPVATFEAKYVRPTSADIRSHAFQALTTASAYRAPLSVLVYPEAADSVSWTVHGFDGHPATIVAVGLDMYGFRRSTGEADRGRTLLDICRFVLTRGAPPPAAALSVR